MVFAKLELERENEHVGRSRDMYQCSGYLGLPTSKEDGSSYGSYLYHLIKLNLNPDSDNELVWVDLGCGNEIALRQAKVFLERDGINPDRLKTYGVDLYPNDAGFGRDITPMMNLSPKEYSRNFLDDTYAPVRLCGDITTVVFPEAPNLITAVQVLQWNKDPLTVFTNAVNQLELGGIIGLHNTGKIYFTDDNQTHIEKSIPPETYPLLFEELFNYSSRVNGLVQFGYDDGVSIMLRKGEDSKFVHNHQLIARSINPSKAFSHLYAPKD